MKSVDVLSVNRLQPLLLYLHVCVLKCSLDCVFILFWTYFTLCYFHLLYLTFFGVLLVYHPETITSLTFNILLTRILKAIHVQIVFRYINNRTPILRMMTYYGNIHWSSILIYFISNCSYKTNNWTKDDSDKQINKTSCAITPYTYIIETNQIKMCFKSSVICLIKSKVM